MSNQNEKLEVADLNDGSPVAQMAHAIASDPGTLCMDGMSIWELMQAMANAQAIILLRSGMSGEDAHQRMKDLYDIMVQVYEMSQEGGTA